MAKKKLIDKYPSNFDGWFSVYLVENGMMKQSTFTFSELRKIAHEAYIRGYLNGSNAMYDILSK